MCIKGSLKLKLDVKGFVMSGAIIYIFLKKGVYENEFRKPA